MEVRTGRLPDRWDAPSVVGWRSVSFGGPDRDRTGYLRHAMAALYQVSYGPQGETSMLAEAVFEFGRAPVR